MNTIIFIGSNKSGSSREAIKAAERLGYLTVLFTNKQQFLEQRLEFPDVHQMIFTELSDYQALTKSIQKLVNRGLVIQAILSFIDPYVNIAVSLEEKFCTNVVSVHPILNMEDKVLTRNLLKSLRSSPYFTIYTSEDSLKDFLEEQKNHLPLIVKSPISAGSKDVLLASDIDQLNFAMKKLLNKYKDTPILIEEFLTGPQYLVETVVHDGTITIVAVIEQEITFQERFIVTGYSLLAYMDKQFFDHLYESVCTIVETFDMKNGACHLELRLVRGRWKLIEINPRISGGAMNRLIEVGYGINLVEETIQIFLGNQPNLTKKHRKYVYVQYLTVDIEGKLVSVTGKNRASQYPGVQEVFIKPRKGKILRPPLSMGDRYGYVLASSYNNEEAKQMAMAAAKEIRFNIEKL
ncbi:ATP-grasp domain-containing protein [Peribacillus loiseleuriae]|uniref:Biotin carboxylase n=1 Tax=Peribacillus loiseleuriae TaxID=1679170 RepID=A0A0K9GTP2_9BACI|nr:ATP-grasp domain-containing protein [Peribacillus loiseleuriae]KMY50025.1 biotin carboxylase [Peribacillus loiseleuriae]